MTKAQREILVANLEAEFTITTVEYPSGLTGIAVSGLLKIVTQVDGERWVDYYDEEGRTVSSFSSVV